MVSKNPKTVTPEADPYLKPPSMSTSQSLKTFIYNPETGAFMGRTASSWGKLRLLIVTEKHGNGIYDGRSVTPLMTLVQFVRAVSIDRSIDRGDLYAPVVFFVLRIIATLIEVKHR